MDEQTFSWLLTPEGQRVLAEAEASDLSDSARLRTLTLLRRIVSPERAAAALETAVLRERAVAKFGRAHAMYFTRDALEQATAEAVAAHRANRFAGVDRIVDLGCGIGGDTLALARVASVVGIDRDRLRLRIARANVAAYGLDDRTAWVMADAAGGGPVLADAAFVDPARRTAAGRRVYRTDDYAPPLSDVLGWRGRFRRMAVKVAPGITDADTAHLGGEAEFVAVGEELKECVLWFGEGVSRGRRATVLPAGDSMAASHDHQPRVLPAGRVLYEPNPAVIRAHLIGRLAATLDAWQIDETIAYLSAGDERPTPFARSWVIDEVLPFGVDRVRRRLREIGVGRVTVKKRGSPLEPEAFARMLHLQGEEQRTVVLTRQLDRPVALICRDRVQA